MTTIPVGLPVAMPMLYADRVHHARIVSGSVLACCGHRAIAGTLVCGRSGKTGMPSAAIRSAQRSKKGSRSATGASSALGARSVLGGVCRCVRIASLLRAHAGPDGRSCSKRPRRMDLALIVIRRQTQHRRQRKHEMGTQQERFARTVPA